MINRASRHIAPAKKPKTKRLNVIILAGGIPRKLKTKGPKSLYKIYQNMSLLEVQYRSLPKFEEYDVREVLVVTGFEHEKIRRKLRGLFDIKFIFNPIYDQTNMCYSIGLALESCCFGDILIIYGDILFSKSLLTNIHKDKVSKILIDENDIISNHKIGVGIEDGKVTNMAYSLSTKFGGIVFFTQKEAGMLEKIIFNHEKSKCWFLHEAIMDIIDNGGEFYPLKSGKDQLLEIENKRSLKEIGNIK